MTTRAYPLERPCHDCGATPTRIVRFWVNGMRYCACKRCVSSYRRSLLRDVDPKTGE